jgi:hypothetical protein
MSNIESVEVFCVGYSSKYKNFGVFTNKFKNELEYSKIFYFKNNSPTKRKNWIYLFSEMIIKTNV